MTQSFAKGTVPTKPAGTMSTKVVGTVKRTGKIKDNNSLKKVDGKSQVKVNHKEVKAN